MNEIITPKPPSFAALVQYYFTEYLSNQRALSSRTIASYRDSIMLFLNFAHAHIGKTPTALELSDITPDLILAFLDYLERDRHNSVRSRNLRLTALRAFMKYAARKDVSALYVVERALSIPMKRFEHPMLNYLSREEMLAVLGQPNETWISQRDHLLLTMLYNTGARVSEVIGIYVADLVLDGAACVHLCGKGRKQRSIPLWKSTAQEIRVWLKHNPMLNNDSALLPNRDGHMMTRDNVNRRLAIAVARASKVFPSLANRQISPHTIRHTTAMHLLQSGVAFSVIALWLGHESTTTTHRYVEANLAMKEQALARLQEPETEMHYYQPPDELLQFLQSL
ncbi:MAG: tyrosine-type recombinase/integrase [Methyloprofundus sp.]|nr:tyrosine-type recombinase/integrase [Methyloprofundus sp.]